MDITKQKCFLDLHPIWPSGPTSNMAKMFSTSSGPTSNMAIISIKCSQLLLDLHPIWLS